MGVRWRGHRHNGSLYSLHCEDDCLEVLSIDTEVDFRTKFRKQANAADNKAATIIIDSLINYEAVKVCPKLSNLTY